MKTTSIIFCLVLGFVPFAGGCRKPAPVADSKEKSDNATKKVADSDLSISAEMQHRSGIVVAPLESAEWVEGLDAAGRVMDPGPFIQLVFDLAAARATSDASARELARNQKLNTIQENISRHAVETAEATAQRDALATEIAAQKLIAAWGPSLAERTDLPEFAHALVSQEAALVRLELSPERSLMQAPASIVVTLPGNAKLSWSAEFVGFSATADAQTQGQGILALITSHPPTVGLSVLGKIGTGAAPKTGVRLPRSAVVRFGDATFIYLQKTPETFERRPIHTAGNLGSDWFVSGELSAGDRVVVEGAQQLLSEELKGTAPAD